MKKLIILIAVLILAGMTGCVGGPWGATADYTVIIYDPATGNKVKEFHGISARDFEEVVTSYEEDEFKFKAGKAEKSDDPYAAVTAAVLSKALDLLDQKLTVKPPLLP